MIGVFCASALLVEECAHLVRRDGRGGAGAVRRADQARLLLGRLRAVAAGGPCRSVELVQQLLYLGRQCLVIV